MRKKITHNLGLKILALFIAVAMWFSIVNISDPVTSALFSDIPVTIRHAGSVTDEGKVFTVLDNTDMVNVRVYAPRSVLESFSASDIVVVADMEDMTFMNTVTYKVNFGRFEDNIEKYVLSADNMKVAIEDVKGIQMAVSPVTVGQPMEGYVIGGVNMSQNMVRLTGGESVINRIARAEATVDIDGWSSDINTMVPLKLYDRYDNEISTSQLTTAVSDVNVNIRIFPTKEVSVTVENIIGTPAEGYVATGNVFCEPETVTIAGPAATLAQIDTITVPEGIINVTGQSANMKVNVDIAEYLPNGIIVVPTTDEDDVSVILTAEVSKLVTRTFLVPSENIAITGVPEGYSAEVTSASLEAGFLPVELRGTTSALNRVPEANTWQLSVDIEAQAKVLYQNDVEDATVNGEVKAETFDSVVVANGPLMIHVRLFKDLPEEETEEIIQ